MKFIHLFLSTIRHPPIRPTIKTFPDIVPVQRPTSNVRRPTSDLVPILYDIYNLGQNTLGQNALGKNFFLEPPKK